MASPFSVFRRNQKVMMAGITILAMAAFVLVNPFGGSGRSGQQGGPGVTVATWNFGRISLSDVENRLQSRHMVNAFLAGVFAEAKKKGSFSEAQQFRPFPESRPAALESIVLHKKAEQLGLTVSDGIANEFINRVADDKLTGQELDAIARSLSQLGMRPTTEQIVAALRFELEVNKLRELLESDFYGMTPEQRYDYYGRLHRKAVIQVLPVEVKDFVSKVPNPSDAELQALFEKYKENFASPDSPLPGFKVPPKAKFQFFAAKVDDFVNAEKPKVTDDEIKKYYEDHKERFRKSDDSGSDSTSKSVTPEKGSTAEKAKPDDKNSGKPATKPGTSGAASEKASPEKTEKPATDKSSSEPPASSKPTSEKGPAETKPPSGGTSPDAPTTTPSAPSAVPTENKPADGKPADKSSQAPGKSSHVVPTPRSVLGAALFAMVDADPPAASKSPEPKATDKRASDASKTPDSKSGGVKSGDGDKDNKPADKNPADSKPPADKPSDNATDKTPATTTEPSKPTSSTGVPDLGLKPSEPPKKIPVVDYEPLESVRDKIRTDIARERAMKQIDEALKSLRSTVLAFQGNYSRWVALQQGAEPQPPDFAALAKAKGLRFEQTGLLSAQELYDTTEFGKSVVFTFSPDSRSFQSSVLQQAFDPRIQKFKPYESYHIDPEIDFLWWRVDYKEAYVPKFENAKNEVLNAFKMIEARKLALAQAQDYADQVKKQQAELQEVFKFRPELHPSKDIGPFTWLSVPSTALNPEMQAPPQLTKVPGLDKIGDDFMRTVFTMDVGSTGKAMNAPQTIVYVIQLKSLAPGEDQFRREFLQRAASRMDDSGRVEQLESQQMLNSKIGAIFNEFDYKPAQEGTDALFGKGGTAGAPTSSDED